MIFHGLVIIGTVFARLDTDMSDEKWYYVDVDYAVFAVVTYEDRVTSVPPIAKWMIGKHIYDVIKWVNKHHGKIERGDKR